MTSSHVEQLIASMGGIDGSKLSANERSDLAAAAQALRAKVERPWDALFRVVWGEPALYASLRTLVDLNLFEKWVAQGGADTLAQDLASMVNADPELLVRLLRHAAANHVITNPGPGTYGLTDLSRSLAERTQTSVFRYLYDVNLPIFAALPAYLAEQGYKNPTDPTYAAFNLGKNTESSIFEHFKQNKSQGEDFHHVMQGVAGFLTRWVEIYPTEKLLGGEDSEVVVVDVGGSTGHDLSAFQKKHRLAPGRLVLQDLPEVVAGAQVEQGIVVTAHDFFKPQPVKGATAYYLHSILHDWPDHKAREILEQLKPALVRGKSRILLHEVIIWPQENSPFVTYADLTMLGSFNARERTLDMWKSVIEPVGLKITEAYQSASTPHSIMEVELV